MRSQASPSSPRNGTSDGSFWNEEPAYSCSRARVGDWSKAKGAKWKLSEEGAKKAESLESMGEEPCPPLPPNVRALRYALPILSP